MLGHCICDVRRPCPCDVFRDDGICPCAGERPDPVDLAQVKLMEWVRNAGCASKIAPAELDAVLGRLPAVSARERLRLAVGTVICLAVVPASVFFGRSAT